MVDRDWIYDANKINKEIKELDRFLFRAEKVWTGKLIMSERTYVIESSPFGYFDSVEYDMDTEIKNEVLDVLRNRREQLIVELEEIRRA